MAKDNIIEMPNTYKETDDVNEETVQGRTDLTDDEKRMNAEAVKVLIRSKPYRFNPPVESIGFFIGQPGKSIPVASFERGWYIGFKDEYHIFQGKPVGRREECFFRVDFTGGSLATIDDGPKY